MSRTDFVNWSKSGAKSKRKRVLVWEKEFSFNYPQEVPTRQRRQQSFDGSSDSGLTGNICALQRQDAVPYISVGVNFE